jgi:hypothetical protein
VGNLRQFGRIFNLLEGAHNAFVSAASVTSRGKPRRCRYSRFHSPGLHAYAKELVGA